MKKENVNAAAITLVALIAIASNWAEKPLSIVLSGICLIIALANVIYMLRKKGG